MATLYGVLTEKDLYNQRVEAVSIETVLDAVTQSVEEHNRQLDAMMGLFVQPTTEYKTRFLSAATARLQPLDAAGRALPLKPGGQYDLAFPLHMAGAAWGTDYVTSKKMKVQELARITSLMLDADTRWMRDHILAALFYKSSTNPWTFTDPAHGSLSIYGLANGDTVTYQVMTGGDSSPTDDHLKGTGALAAATFQDIHDELKEHPENEGDVIAFIPTNLKATAEGLTGYYPVADMNLRQGANVTVLTGRLNAPIPGEIIGYCEGCWIAEWRSLPDNYVIGCMTGGEKSLAMREDEEQDLRGFREVADRDDHPWYEKQYLRRAGFGGWNRVGAIVYRCDNATYAIPTGYTSPMA